MLHHVYSDVLGEPTASVFKMTTFNSGGWICFNLIHVTLKRWRRCSTVQYSTVQYSTVQYSTVLYCTVLYSWPYAV